MSFRFFTSVLLILCIITLTACDDDEQEKPLLTVIVPENSMLSTHALWILITDIDNTILDFRKLNNGDKVFFKRPAGFSGERIHVHRLAVTSTPSGDPFIYGLSSYLATKGGTMRMSSPFSEPVQVGEHSFTITDVPEDYFELIRTAPYLHSTNFTVNEAGAYTGKTPILENNHALFYWLFVDDGSNLPPRYRYLDPVQAGDNLAVSYNDLTEADAKTISLGTDGVEADEAIVTIASDEPGENYPFSVAYSYSESGMEVFHPGNTFSSYLTRIRLNTINKTVIHEVRGSIPSAFKPLNASVLSIINADNTFTVTTIGSYDYTLVSGSSNWEAGGRSHALYWDVYLDDEAVKTFTLPMFPTAILEAYPALATATVFEAPFVDIGDYDTANGYDAYVNMLWNKNVPFEFNEHRSWSKNFSTGGRKPASNADGK